MVGASSSIPEGRGIDPWSGHIPRLYGFDPWLGHVQEAADQCFSDINVSLSLSISLKINKHNLG